MIKVSTLKERKRNPRKISPEALQRLADSIQRDPDFMALRPIVTDGAGVVWGGNQRLKAIRDILGMKEIPDEWVKKADTLTDEQKDRFLLVDNAPDGMAGVWDMDILLTDFDVPNLEELGFDLAGANDLNGYSNFEPGTEQEQGKLDQLSPKMVLCPHCGQSFDSRGHEQG